MYGCGTERILLRIGSSAWVLEIQQGTFVFCKGLGIALLAERLLLSQEGLLRRQFLLFIVLNSVHFSKVIFWYVRKKCLFWYFVEIRSFIIDPVVRTSLIPVIL